MNDEEHNKTERVIGDRQYEPVLTTAEILFTN
jgi:hypothetical protein